MIEFIGNRIFFCIRGMNKRKKVVKFVWIFFYREVFYDFYEVEFIVGLLRFGLKLGLWVGLSI